MKHEVCLDDIRLEHISEFKYLGCVLDDSGTHDAECRRKVVNRWKFARAISSLVNVRGL